MCREILLESTELNPQQLKGELHVRIHCVQYLHTVTAVYIYYVYVYTYVCCFVVHTYVHMYVHTTVHEVS